MENSEKKNSTTRFLICSFIGLLTVSYTHLDVYKRQTSCCSVFL